MNFTLRPRKLVDWAKPFMWFCVYSVYSVHARVCVCLCASKQQNDYCEHSSRCLATESLCFLGNSCLALTVWVIGSLDNGDGVTLDLAC